MLASVKDVALELSNNQSEACDFCWEITQLDTAKVGKWYVRAAMRLDTTIVYDAFDRTQFLIGNNKEVAATAGWVKDPNA